jgi:hypothetical protein
MNNAYAGTNLYDIGLLFNRGSDTNQAFIWDETEDEFRLIGTGETGTTYGNVTASSFANLHIGNITVDYIASVGTLNLTNATLTGDLAVNGGDITTTASTFNLINTDATTVNFAGAATSVVAGATTGTFNLRNANIYLPNATTLYSGQSTLSLANENVTTLNFAGAATALTLGATSGTATIRNANVAFPNATTFFTSQATISLFDANATTVDAFKAATDIEIGATSGTFKINNTALVGSQSTQDVFNTAATTVNAFGAATTANIGAGSGTITINNPTLVGQQTTQNLYNTVATTMNFAGAATSVNIGAASGTTNIKNNVDVDLTLNARDINSTVIGNVTPATGKFTNIYNTALTETRVTFVGTANVITDSANLTFVTDTLTIRNLSVDGDTNTIATSSGNINLLPSSSIVDVGSATLANVADPTELQDAVTLNYLNTQISSAVTNIQDDDSDITITDTGSAAGQITGNVDAVRFITVNANTTAFYGDSSAAIVYIDELNSNVGINGTAHIGDDLTVAAGGIVYVKDTTEATAVNSGALQVTGGASVAGNLYVGSNNSVAGNIEITASTPSTSTSTGALRVSGGAGIAGNVWIGANLTVTGDLTVQGNVVSLNTSTLDVEDLNITVAKGAADSAAADGAGLTVDGAGATILYTHATTSWNINKTLIGIDATLSGDLAVNGGDLTTTAATFNLLNANATTVDAFKAATDLEFGATSGTLTINNPTVVGSQTTQALYNTTATTLNFAGDATSVVAGATTGTFNIRNANVYLPNATTLYSGQSTLDIANVNVTTLSIGGAATALVLGATTGTLTLRNATVTTPGQIVSTRAGSATTGDGQIFLNGATSNRIDWAATGTGAPTFTTRTDGTKVVLYPALSGSTVDYAIGIDSATMWSSIPEATSGFNFKWYGAETLVANLSGTGNFTTVGDIAVNGGDLTTTAATFNLLNTDATTLNVGGAATSIVAGATSGTFNIRNANLYLPNASTVFSGQSTVAFMNNVPTTVTAWDAATALTLGDATGYTRIDSGNIYLPNAANIASTQATVAVFNTDTTTVNAFGAATSVVAGAASGTFNIRNANLYLPNASTIFSGQSTLSFANTVTTTADLLGDATSIRIGSSTSEVIARSNVTVGSHLRVISNQNADTGGNAALVVNGGAFITANIITPSIAVVGGTIITGSFPSTSVDNGALVIETGGAGIDGNINVGDGAQFNINQSLNPFRVYGKFANTLIYADSVTDTVTIGGSNVASVAGTTLRVNGNGAMIIPIGASSDRPGSSGNVDVDGMIRLNSTTNVFEYYIDGGWQTSQGAFTVITSDNFNGNGVANTFVLSSSTTTTATMVMINGVVQIPSTSYSISGNVLAFTESPETGDVIDVRSLTTTVTVAEIGSGFNNFKANVDYLFLTTGTSSGETRMLVDTTGLTTFTGDVEIYGNLTVKGNSDGQITIGDTAGDNVAFNADVNSSVTPNVDDTYNLGSATKRWKNVFAGNIVHDQTAINTSSTTTVIDSFATSNYSSAKYIVQVKNGANIEAMEALVVSTSADAYITTYGIINAGYAMGSLTANVVSGNVRLYYTTALSNSNVKVQTTYIV